MGIGFEIWRVPKCWQHPTDSEGKFIPIHCEDYDHAAKEWLEGLEKWQKKEGGKDTRYYWEVAGKPPVKEHYDPFETQPLCCYQVYEEKDLSIPLSPVFDDQAGIEEWLVAQGRTREFARVFSKYGFYKPSPVEDGTGCFLVRRDVMRGECRWVRFHLNDYSGEAVLIGEESVFGVPGTLIVQELNIYDYAKPVDPYGSWIFSYPIRNGKPYQELPFLGDLVVLLKNLP